MTLTDDNPDIVERMIKYLYTHRYDDDQECPHACCDTGIRRIEKFYEATERNHRKAQNEFMHSTAAATEIVASDAQDNAAGPNLPVNRINDNDNDNDDEIEDDNEKYTTATASSTPSEPPKSLHVFAIADKYLIYPLKDLARTRFASWASSHWWTRAFVAAAREIFDNETGNYADLREVIFSTLVLHADTLICGNGGSSSSSDGNDSKASAKDQESDIQKFMQDYNEVSVEVLRRTLDRTRIRQRGLEVDIADLESRVNALKIENKKIAVLQSRNQSLNKQLLEARMATYAWKRDATGDYLPPGAVTVQGMKRGRVIRFDNM